MDYYKFDSTDGDLDEIQRKIILGSRVIRDVLNNLPTKAAVSILVTVTVSACRVVKEAVGHDGLRDTIIKALEDSRPSRKENHDE